LIWRRQLSAFGPGYLTNPQKSNHPHPRMRPKKTIFVKFKKNKGKIKNGAKKRNYQNQVAPAATPHRLQHNVGKNGG
jgi:hypothetical protein